MLGPLDDEVVADVIGHRCPDAAVVLPEFLDVDDLALLIELFHLDILDVRFGFFVLDVLVEFVLLYDDVAAAQFEFLNVLDELADLVGLVVGCRCQSLLS